MSNLSSPNDSGGLRRRALLGALAGGAVASVAAVSKAQPAEKSSKAKVHYQDQPKDVRSCGTCLYFEAPAACSVMEGKVSSHGWCDLYALVD